MSRVIVLEMNELTPRLVHEFIAGGYLPNFKTLFEKSQVYQTDAGETGLNLNPWIQWHTVHSGQSFEDHKVYLLGEGHSAASKTLGNIISESGLSVALFGSMNVGFNKPINGIGMPDAWAEGVTAYPDTLEPFRKFVQSQVQEHTNPEFKPTLGNYLRFLSFMLKNGLSFGTCREIATQLLKERVSDIRWKRPFILDSLQWDVFSSHYRREKPDFATFFSNSVAHTQHTHWREFEPSAFDVKPTEDEIQKFGNAVRAAYEANDRIVGKALSLIDDDTTLVFCTALSQRPAVEWEAEGGKTFYRPFDMEKFCRFLGVPGDFKCRPVMSEEFWIELEEGTALQTAVDILDGATVGDRKLMKTFVRDGGVYTGCGLHSALPEDTEFTTHDGRTATIGEFLYKSDDVKSGAHDPNGMLWICTPKREHEDVAQEDVPLESIAPTILRLLNIKVPDSMTAAPLPRVFQ